MRSFIAISLQTNDLLDGVVREVRHLGKTVEGKNLHLTLKFLGDVGEVDKVRKNLEDVRGQKFTLTLKGIGAFPSTSNGRVLFVRAHPEVTLKELAKDVDAMTKEIPLDHPFTPHITLLRTKERRDFSTLVSRYENVVFAEQDISSFSLFESILTPTGPIYREIQKYQLM